jgi:arylsulfatase A-like enzyme
MTAAAVAFCCFVALALVQGFGAPAFTGPVASDAFSAALPFLGILLVARFALRRMPRHTVLVHRVHATIQGLLAGLSYGWWWVEPHAALAQVTGGSLAAMGWTSVLGAAVGLVFALAAERASRPVVAREVALGSWVFFLIGGGRVYRAFDHVEAGTRLMAASAIVAAILALALALYFLLRKRERLATGLVALAPALACAAMLVASREGGAAAPTTRDSVLLVVIDTLREDIADGRFAADRDAMPELARIATSGVRFTQAVSPAPWTLPATVSLLSGWNPHRHRYGVSASAWEVLPGDPRAMYLAGALRDAGYLTSAFVHNPYLRPWFGFGPGFYTLRPYHGRAIDGVALALDWLQDHAGSPSFTLLHLMDPHWPYDAPPGFGQPRQPCGACDWLVALQAGPTSEAVHDEVKRRYAAVVHYTDAVLGRFYDGLAASGALDHTWLVVTADHGEELWDHGGFLHGHSLYDELLRVPLVIVPPRSDAKARRGVRVDAQVRLEDVAATLLEVAGLDASLAPDGKSLTPLLIGKPDLAPRTEVAGLVKSPQDLSYAVRQPPWKAVVAPQAIASNRLFQLGDDPGEAKNLLFDPALPLAKRSELSIAFQILASWPGHQGIDVNRTPVSSSSSVPDADTRRQLRSLGYAE